MVGRKRASKLEQLVHAGASRDVHALVGGVQGRNASKGWSRRPRSKGESVARLGGTPESNTAMEDTCLPQLEAKRLLYQEQANPS